MPETTRGEEKRSVLSVAGWTYFIADGGYSSSGVASGRGDEQRGPLDLGQLRSDEHRHLALSIKKE